ncbi:MAG: hypothetical protein IPN27_07475 [Cellvibrionales bacterium]|nr:hypothetical protein [Cellvibrionales bacterium]
MMETLADLARCVLGIDTFTVAFTAWLRLFSLPAAKQLASLLILLAFALIAIGQWQRGARRCSPAGRCVAAQAIANTGVVGGGWLRLRALAAFIVPLLQRCCVGLGWRCHGLDGRYLDFVGHSCCWRC